MRSFARRHAGALVLSSLVIFTTLLVVPHVRDYTAVSPSDELQHIDATVKWTQERTAVGAVVVVTGRAAHRGCSRVG